MTSMLTRGGLLILLVLVVTSSRSRIARESERGVIAPETVAEAEERWMDDGGRAGAPRRRVARVRQTLRTAHSGSALRMGRWGRRAP